MERIFNKDKFRKEEAEVIFRQADFAQPISYEVACIVQETNISELKDKFCCPQHIVAN